MATEDNDRKTVSAELRLAAQAETRALKDELYLAKKPFSQGAIGKLLGGLSQTAVGKLLNDADLGADVLERLLRFRGLTSEQLLAKHSGSVAAVADRVPRRTLEQVDQDAVAEALARYPFDEFERYGPAKAIACCILEDQHGRKIKSQAIAEVTGVVVGFDEDPTMPPARLALHIVTRVLHGRAIAKGKAVEGVDLEADEFTSQPNVRISKPAVTTEGNGPKRKR